MQYNIQLGDTLSGIAQKFDTTIEELLKLNPDITNPDQISAGQPLEVPEQQSVNQPTPVPEGSKYLYIVEHTPMSDGTITPPKVVYVYSVTLLPEVQEEHFENHISFSMRSLRDALHHVGAGGAMQYLLKAEENAPNPAEHRIVSFIEDATGRFTEFTEGSVHSLVSSKSLDIYREVSTEGPLE